MVSMVIDRWILNYAAEDDPVDSSTWEVHGYMTSPLDI